MSPDQLHDLLSELPPGAPVLDCGGWFIPLNAATHVVDLMPYETRRGRLELTSLPGEKFTRDTWYQADFLAPDFRLPFPDKFFAFSHCSHTLEDLANPEPLLRELVRVSQRGLLVCPSRLSEQTAGSSNRITNRQGHPHHHWIVDTENGRPVFYAKADSLASAWWGTAVPLRTYERLNEADPSVNVWTHVWSGSLDWQIVRGPAARARAVDFARRTRSSALALPFDCLWRGLRQAKHRLRRRRGRAAADWWSDMVALSRPYNRLP
ncbi:MAG: methyltransferase domain-containing protein [Verrucomicrobia bacterium]|nr:methyltransferase domain-containing protein [Verrucomicrobiota bacterium]